MVLLSHTTVKSSTKLGGQVPLRLCRPAADIIQRYHRGLKAGQFRRSFSTGKKLWARCLLAGIKLSQPFYCQLVGLTDFLNLFDMLQIDDIGAVNPGKTAGRKAGHGLLQR